MSDPTSLEKLQPELFPGEKLLWSGRPALGAIFNFWNIVGIVIGVALILCCLAGWPYIFGIIPIPFWMYDDHGNSPRAAFIFFQFVLIPYGAYAAGGGIYLDAYFRRHLFYGVTNERILILRELRRDHQSLTSLRLRDVPHLTLMVKPDGSGSLNFATRTPGTQNQQASLLGLCFRLIPEVRKVYTLIRSVEREAA